MQFTGGAGGHLGFMQMIPLRHHRGFGYFNNRIDEQMCIIYLIRILESISIFHELIYRYSIPGLI